MTKNSRFACPQLLSILNIHNFKERPFFTPVGMKADRCMTKHPGLICVYGPHGGFQSSPYDADVLVLEQGRQSRLTEFTETMTLR